MGKINHRIYLKKKIGYSYFIIYLDEGKIIIYRIELKKFTSQHFFSQLGLIKNNWTAKMLQLLENQYNENFTDIL